MRVQDREADSQYTQFTSPYPEFYAFLADKSLSGSATLEELRALDSIRFCGKPPTKEFYCRRPLQLRARKGTRSKRSG